VLYHFTNACTRLQFAELVLRAAGHPEPAEALAAVPGRIVLNCRLFELVTGHRLPDWQEGGPGLSGRSPGR